MRCHPAPQVDIAGLARHQRRLVDRCLFLGRAVHEDELPQILLRESLAAAAEDHPLHRVDAQVLPLELALQLIALREHFIALREHFIALRE